jgi:hypothetical protein
VTYTAIGGGNLGLGTGGGGGTTTPTPEPEPETEIIDEGPALAAFTLDHIAYINGYPDGTVRPDGSLSRAETAMMIFRLLGDAEKDDAIASQFADVADGAWYAQAVSYLASIDIITGYEDGTFRPDQKITRAEFVTILSRFEMSEPGELGRFSDAAGHWAESAISAAAELGWTDGYPDGTFRPNALITRAESATIINRMLERGIDAEDIPDYAPSYIDLSPSHWAYAEIIEASFEHKYFTREEDGSELWLTEEEAAAAEEDAEGDDTEDTEDTDSTP